MYRLYNSFDDWLWYDEHDLFMKQSIMQNTYFPNNIKFKIFCSKTQLENIEKITLKFKF